MTNTFKLFLVLAIVAFVGTSCKSKQKVAEITGANVTVAESVPVTTVTTTTVEAVEAEPEVTRNESFSLSDGDSDALNSKYHVVVGSFKSQSNAKGLKETLNSEGNKAIVVINEQNMYRVIIASYNQYAQARTKINGINNRFADAWVLVQQK
jgi:cell division protein FtsN